MLAHLLALVAVLGQSPEPGAAYAHVGATPPPHGYPSIKSFTISSTQIHPGRAVHGDVVTTENVHYVEARVDYREVALHEDGPGRFSLSYTVPWWLPPWLRRGYTLQIIARSIDGVETSLTIPITVR
jgi:hypothetical protein